MSRHHAPLASAAPDTVFAPAAVELVDVELAFGKTVVVDGVSLRVEKGERVALIGPNGAGKSTLFDLVSGRRRPRAGEIWLAGRRVERHSEAQRARAGLGRSFQGSNFFAGLSVRENLACAVASERGVSGMFWRRASRVSVVERRTDELLDQIGLAAQSSRLAGELGYADQRALEVGLAVATDPDLLLLDEPTAGMSQSETRHFVTLIDALSRHRSLLMIEHDMSVVFELADRVAVLVQGTIIAFDTPARIRANARVQAAYTGATTSGDVAPPFQAVTPDEPRRVGGAHGRA